MTNTTNLQPGTLVLPVGNDKNDETIIGIVLEIPSDYEDYVAVAWLSNRRGAFWTFEASVDVIATQPAYRQRDDSGDPQLDHQGLATALQLMITGGAGTDGVIHDDVTLYPLARIFAASETSVAKLLAEPMGYEEDGRTPWKWVRFTNGELGLVTFPRSETYFALEPDVEADYKTSLEPPKQTYRVEVRFDVTGTKDEAYAAAHKVAGEVGGEVTAVMDENWDDA